MALKNFFCKGNGVEKEVAGMKTFLSFLTQPGPTFWPQ